MRKYPNSYCKSCHSFSMKHSNEVCAARLDDGTKCKVALYSIPENGLVDCPACKGTGKDDEHNCIVCNGYGYEFKG